MFKGSQLLKLVAPLGRLPQRIADIAALQKLAGLSPAYVPWTSSAVRPAALVVMLNDVVVNQRDTLVEFGSGTSTFFFAQLLKEQGGTLFSVEHNMDWADLVESKLCRYQLDDYVNIIRAPLTASPYQQRQRALHEGDRAKPYEWYDTSILDTQLPDDGVDLVFADGPPAYEAELRHARYPTLPYMWNRLASSAAVFLDDAFRDGERAVLSGWEKEHPLTFTKLKTYGGIAFAHRGNSYTIL